MDTKTTNISEITLYGNTSPISHSFTMPSIQWFKQVYGNLVKCVWYANLRVGRALCANLRITLKSALVWVWLAVDRNSFTPSASSVGSQSGRQRSLRKSAWMRVNFVLSSPYFLNMYFYALIPHQCSLTIEIQRNIEFNHSTRVRWVSDRFQMYTGFSWGTGKTRLWHTLLQESS